MLIYYRFNNFCSFYSQNEFSMNAPQGKVKRRFPDNYVETPEGFSLLKSAVIVGENAGGKSNFINSLKFLQSLFINNARVKSVRSYVNVTSLKDNENPIQDFEICFRAQNKKIYQYQLQINADGVLFEQLQVIKSKKVKPVTVFMKKLEENQVQVDDPSLKRLWEYYYMIQKVSRGEKVNSIGLFVTKNAILGDPDALAVVNWMTNVLCLEEFETSKADDVIRQENELEILKDERFLEIFRMVDYSICGVEVDDENPYNKSVVVRKNENGDLFRRELQMDSSGVREFFSWAVSVFRVVYRNKVLFADEMDRVLNPVLSDRVIAFVNGNEHTGQFIFSTHNVLHLDLKTFLKEQIYFITKDRERLISEMYSLADFPEVRYETTKIYEFYMKGILGGTAFE